MAESLQRGWPMRDAAGIPERTDAEPVLANLLATPQGRRILTCIQCGVCAGTCPYGEVMDYPPRRIIGLLRSGDIEEALSSESLLGCVGCYACMAKCPRGIRLTEVLLPLVKEEVFLRLPDVPSELKRALDNTLRYGNPMGASPRKRAQGGESAGGALPVLAGAPPPAHLLLFFGCYPSY